MLFPSPNYSAEESSVLFIACHRLIEDLLTHGIPVIFDATNLSENNREQLYRISDRAAGKLVLVRVEVCVRRIHAVHDVCQPAAQVDEREVAP